MTNTTTIRFFCVAYIDSDSDLSGDHIDTVEITESCFVALTRESSGTAPTQYERHTIADNGVSQVCLTLDLDDWPHIGDLDTV
jgi:hypothetical protein